ncbi:UNVERIFIED_CONTAM: hypothetical protein Sradi_5733800 [Sesamum radiatum]|uniref:Uncharacterized protein n=1 Tax=Sesamum radiatum TaxID=300843 RepID=A0AAW2L517_SESRA
MPLHRIHHFSEERNSELLKEHLDLVDELRETAFIRTQQYKSTMIYAHNKRVKARHFQVGDLVLRRIDTLKLVGKLDPKWEGPKNYQDNWEWCIPAGRYRGAHTKQTLEHTQPKEILFLGYQPD